MTSRIPPKAMNLRQFMLRAEVLRLYREFMRAIRQIPSESDRKEFLVWTREDFKNNKHHTDETVIRMNLSRGRRMLEELNTNAGRAR